MIPSLGAALAALLVITLKASAVLLVAVAATALMRWASAAARHLVWAVALCCVLALPAVELVVPEWELPLPELPSAAPIPAAAAVDPSPAGSSSSVPAAEASSPSPAPAEPVRPAPARRLPDDWRVWLALLWGAGAVLVLARLGVGLAAVWWMSRRAVMVTDASWLHLAHELAHRFGLTRGVTLLRGARGSVPMTWGVLQPVVWLPVDAEEWTSERRTVVLAHELAHVRRRDALTQWIAHLALAAHWFNPLVWLAVRRLREERERACDDAVLAAGARPVDYADHLLQIVRTFGTGGSLLPALAMARRSQFEGRLLAILDPRVSRRALGGIGVALVGIAALGTVVPLAALRAAVREAPAAPSRLPASPVAHTRQDGSERYARRFGIPTD
ncbi:MAG TPA: M56 family metallopeptidase, partial [Longimicrobiaceae bacterium]|nr:M56 family metallopeptidase [Longimicrobiaceae bacterium]